MTGRPRAALLLALAILVVACEGTAYKTANDFVKKWTGATIRQTLRYTLGIPTGSSLIDDMVDSQKAADQMAVAERLYKSAVENNDQDSLETAKELADQAIALRPGDWRYRITRASIAIQQGDTVEMSHQMTEARPRPEDGDLTSPDAQEEARSILEAKIAEFQKVAARVQFTKRDPCEAFMAQMGTLYEDRIRLNVDMSPEDRARNQAEADRYRGLTNQCATLPR